MSYAVKIQAFDEFEIEIESGVREVDKKGNIIIASIKYDLDLSP